MAAMQHPSWQEGRLVIDASWAMTAEELLGCPKITGTEREIWGESGLITMIIRLDNSS